MRFGKGGPSLYNPYGFVEQMRIQSSTGNVGIGTMGPGSKLDVVGDINLSGNLLKGGVLFLHNLGTLNTAVGLGALSSIATGFNNTASGASALQNNTFGPYNTANGALALVNNTMGSQNTASGAKALQTNTIGNNNTAMGESALASVTGSSNTGLGDSAGSNLTTGSYNIMIGSQGLAADDHTIRMGDVQTRTFIAGIQGITTGVSNPVAVLIDTNGQLGTVNSSRRFKEDIQDMGDASSSLMRLRPVTYRYKQPYADGSKPLDYGLIAEEVTEVYPDLVVTNKDGQVQTVQYQKLTPMLLNELQKQQDQIRKLEARLAALEALLSGKAPTTVAAGQ